MKRYRERGGENERRGEKQWGGGQKGEYETSYQTYLYLGPSGTVWFAGGNRLWIH